ncbi:MAG: hypothetical protein HQL51_08220 [Magnetococcales bacterium]|nr:hypothetical protein [Magnetococcales bacterium]
MTHAPHPSPTTRQTFLRTLEAAVRAARIKEDAWRLNGLVLNAMATGLITPEEARRFTVLLDKLRQALDAPEALFQKLKTPPPPPPPGASHRDEFLHSLDEELRTVKSKEDVFSLQDRLLNAMAKGTITTTEARTYATALEQRHLPLESLRRKSELPQHRG